MNLSRRALFGVVLSVSIGASAAGCGGPSYQVIRQATPNPLINVRSYALLPVTWEGFTYNERPESEWLATRTPDQQASWQNDKAGATARYMQRFEIEKRADEVITLANGPLQP